MAKANKVEKDIARTRRDATIHLPYYKQGDDLGHFLSNSETVNEALRSHADMLVGAAEMLRQIAEVIGTEDVDIDADTHMIYIAGPKKVIDSLKRAGLAEKSF